eukprot:evm.model.scf_33.7 EVM.evm.TU.scf_33.7   scf_33:139269-152615(+)
MGRKPSGSRKSSVQDITKYFDKRKGQQKSVAPANQSRPTSGFLVRHSAEPDLAIGNLPIGCNTGTRIHKRGSNRGQQCETHNLDLPMSPLAPKEVAPQLVPMPASAPVSTDRVKEAASYMQWLANASKEPETHTIEQGRTTFLGTTGSEDRRLGETPFKTPQRQPPPVVSAHSTGKGKYGGSVRAQAVQSGTAKSGAQKRRRMEAILRTLEVNSPTSTQPQNSFAARVIAVRTTSAGLLEGDVIGTPVHQTMPEHQLPSPMPQYATCQPSSSLDTCGLDQNVMTTPVRQCGERSQGRSPLGPGSKMLNTTQKRTAEEMDEFMSQVMVSGWSPLLQLENSPDGLDQRCSQGRLSVRGGKLKPPGLEWRSALSEHLDYDTLVEDRKRMRFIVSSVEFRNNEKIAELRNEYKGDEVTAHLTGSWYYTPLQAGDSVNLLASIKDINGSKHAFLDSVDDLLVLHPDFLISGTRTTSAIRCLRQAAIQEWVDMKDPNDRALNGTMTHELFQFALKQQVSSGTTRSQLLEEARAITCRHSRELFEVGLDEQMSFEALTRHIPSILGWLQTYVGSWPKACAMAKPANGPTQEGTKIISIHNVEDTEESIWAPAYGLKGQIDATLRIRVSNKSTCCHTSARSLHNGSIEANNHEKAWSSLNIRPSSFGNPPTGHRGPSASIPSSGSSLGVHECLERPFGCFVSESSQCAGQDAGGVSNGKKFQKGEAGTAAETGIIAPLEFKTGKAFFAHAAQVALYLLLLSERYKTTVNLGFLWYVNQPTMEGVQHVPSEIASIIQQRNALVHHLAQKEVKLPDMLGNERICSKCPQNRECSVLHKAIDGGSLTSSGMGPLFEQFTSHVSPMYAEFLQQWLRLTDLEEGGSKHKSSDIWAMLGEEREAAGGGCVAGLTLQGCLESDSERYLYLFQSQLSGQHRRQCNDHFSTGDMAILSLDGQHACVARVAVHSLQKDGVVLSLKRPLSHRWQTRYREGPWRIDKDSSKSVFKQMRSNLVELISSQNLHEQRLRELIVELQPPRQCSPCHVGQSHTCQQLSPMHGLNRNQMQAIQYVVDVQDYCLILGMPGTGKTTTIANAVKALASSECSILVTAYTNSAVDNILLKLAALGVTFIRLGRNESIHPDLHRYTLGGTHYPDTSTAGLKEICQSIKVVGVTCLSINHPLLAHRRFDVCIVDEAGQISMPCIVGPLCRSQRFVLVGDARQLPPLVCSPRALEEGLGVSLFARLSEAHPQAVTALRCQYRMCSDIMLLANELVYENEMICGSDEVANSRIDIPNWGPISENYREWVHQTLQPCSSVKFLDTDLIGLQDSRASESTINEGESQIIVHLVRALLGAGVASQDIGVVSPYRGQVVLLTQALLEAAVDGVEVLTIDKYQGRDKKCMLISFVRSNQHR